MAGLLWDGSPGPLYDLKGVPQRQLKDNVRCIWERVHDGEADNATGVRDYVGLFGVGQRGRANAVENWGSDGQVNDVFTSNGHVREDGIMVHDMYLVQVKTPAESKETWDYLKIVRTIPANYAFRPLYQSARPLVHR